jgi:hypothetical protein
LASISKKVAGFLGLQDSGDYTGHSFRRSAATSMADQGASNQELKRKFGWNNGNTADEFVDTRYT